MSIPGKYRGLVVVVALALLLGLADKAFSYRLASFATNVVSDLIADIVELTAADPPSVQTTIAPARPLWDASRFEFPSSPENAGAYGGLALADQPWISLGTPFVMDLGAAPAHESGGPTSAPSLPNPGAGRRSTMRQSMARSAPSGSGGAASGGGPVPSGAAGLVTSSADLATAPAAGDFETSAPTESWSELSSGTSAGWVGSGEGRWTDPNQTGAADIGAFGNAPFSLDAPSDLMGPTSLPEALALRAGTGEPALDLRTAVGNTAATPLPGANQPDVGLEWLRQLGSEAALDVGLYSLRGESSRVGESPSPEDAVTVLSEPAMLTVFGIGLLALVSRLRSNARRARS